MRNQSVFVDEASVDERLSMIEAELDEIDRTGCSPVSLRFEAPPDNLDHSGLENNLISGTLEPLSRSGYEKMHNTPRRIPLQAIKSLHSVYNVPDVTSGIDDLTARSSNSSVLDRRELRRERDEERQRRIELQLEAEKYRKELDRLERDAIEDIKCSRAEKARLEQDIRRVKGALAEIEESRKESSREVEVDKDVLLDDLRRAHELLLNRDRDIDLLTASLKDLEKQRASAVANSVQLLEENERISAELRLLKQQKKKKPHVGTLDIDELSNEVEQIKYLLESNRKKNAPTDHQVQTSVAKKRSIGTLVVNSAESLSPPLVKSSKEETGDVSGKPGSIARRFSSSGMLPSGTPFATYSPHVASPKGLAFRGPDLLSGPPLPFSPKAQIEFHQPDAKGTVTVVDPHRFVPPPTVPPALARPPDRRSLLGDHAGIKPIGVIDVVDPQHVSRPDIVVTPPQQRAEGALRPPWALHDGGSEEPSNPPTPPSPQPRDVGFGSVKQKTHSWKRFNSKPADQQHNAVPPLPEEKLHSPSVSIARPGSIQQPLFRYSSPYRPSSVQLQFQPLYSPPRHSLSDPQKDSAEKAFGKLQEDPEMGGVSKEEHAVSSSFVEQEATQLESSLLKLNLEREQLEAWLGRVPAYSAGRTLAERKEKFLKERRLGDVERAVSEVKQKLRAIKHKRSNPMD